MFTRVTSAHTDAVRFSQKSEGTERGLVNIADEIWRGTGYRLSTRGRRKWSRGVGKVAAAVSQAGGGGGGGPRFAEMRPQLSSSFSHRRTRGDQRVLSFTEGGHGVVGGAVACTRAK